MLTPHRRKTMRQLLTFGTIGIISTVAYAALYLLFRIAFSATIANGAALVITLTVDAPTDAVIVVSSPELLDRLVGVLVDNACKYAPEGGTVEVHVALEGGRPTLAVDDSGPGIPQADRERIFDRFHRSVDTATQADGSGLGLAIADAVAKATRGRWSVSESPLGGARFAVRWPAHW